MLYSKDYSDYYVKLIHLLTDDNIYISLHDKRLLDNKVITLVKFLQKIKEKSDKF